MNSGRANTRICFTLALSLGLAGCAGPDPAPEAAPAKVEATPSSNEPGGDGPLVHAPDSPDQPPRILDPRADEVLRAMSALLVSAKQFAFEAEETFDEIPHGQPRVLLSNRRRVAVARPNRFAADVEGDSLNRSVWFDGTTVTVMDKSTLTYAVVPSRGSIDDALDTLAGKYGFHVPLGDLAYGDPHAVLTETVTFSKYLGLHRAAGLSAHHLVFAQPSIEWQIWIDAGERPLPLKLVITYVREPGEPQYTATMSKWNLSPAIPDGLFRFQAPEGAERVAAAALEPPLPNLPR